MDRVARYADQLNDLLNSHLTGIESFQRAPGPKPKHRDTENDRFEDRFISRIEWAIDEDVAVEFRIATRHYYFANFPRFARTSLTAASSFSSGIVPLS